MASLIGKARKPKFELHFKIHDLNNVPLVSGHSFIKWHIEHSIHAEHRGRADKQPIVNHMVDYSFSKTVPHIRISVDKNNHLAECPIEFEILQEFGHQEKITLGVVRLNLSEYIEESESFLRDSSTQTPVRRRTSSVGISPTNATRTARKSTDVDVGVPDGIIRRYLMQESKINSTLKISILMVQVDGDRSYIAPPLRSAPTFGGIAGIVASDQQDDEAGPAPSISTKPRDTTEIQDLYRRTLAASWCRLPVEPTADETIEDIFSGGNGWKTRNDSSTTDTEDDTDFNKQGTLRPSDFHRISVRHHHGHNHHHRQGHHQRLHSGSSDKSALTVTGRKRGARLDNNKDPEMGMSRSGSLTSLTPTISSDRSREAKSHRRLSEVGEDEVREDLIAWRLPGGGAT